MRILVDFEPSGFVICVAVRPDIVFQPPGCTGTTSKISIIVLSLYSQASSPDPSLVLRPIFQRIVKNGLVFGTCLASSSALAFTNACVMAARIDFNT